MLFYGTGCCFSVAFRCVKEIVKHTCEPIIPNYSGKSEQSHVDTELIRTDDNFMT